VLRICLYKFYNKHKPKGKLFTVNQFMSQKVPKRTINNIIKRAENCIRTKRKLGRRQKARKLKKKKRLRGSKKPLTIAINCTSRKQQGNPVSIKAVSVNY
jgi:hypothetical protein